MLFCLQVFVSRAFAGFLLVFVCGLLFGFCWGLLGPRLRCAGFPLSFVAEMCAWFLGGVVAGFLPFSWWVVVWFLLLYFIE